MVSLRSASLLIGLSLFFLVDDLVILFFIHNYTPLHMSRPFLAAAVIIVSVISVVIGWLVFLAMQRRPVTGKEGLVGEKGRALTAMNPRGRVFVRGEIWQAVADGPIQEGESVQVVKVVGMRVYVRHITETFAFDDRD